MIGQRIPERLREKIKQKTKRQIRIKIKLLSFENIWDISNNLIIVIAPQKVLKYH